MANLKIKSEDNTWVSVGGGTNIAIDNALSATSTNPVQNAVITEALNEKVSMYVNEDAGADLPDGYDIYIDTTDGVSQIPMIPGIVYATASQILPEGFLWCNGAEVSRSEYFELFNSIGTAYGVGDGSTTFNVPDLQLRVPMGAGGEFGLGSMGGEAEHTLVKSELPNEQYKVGQDMSSLGISDTWYLTYANKADNGGAHTAASLSGVVQGDWAYTEPLGEGEAHNNLQPYTVVNYIISTGKGAQISAYDIVAGIQTLPLAAEYGGTGFNNLTSLGEALNATGTVGAFTFEEVNF